jgi:predicted DNA-binding transcriptional regulator AlpA
MLEKLIAQIVEETVKVTLQNLSISKQESGNATMDTKQLSKYINMSVPWIYQNLHMIPHKKIGKKKLAFNRIEIDEFMEQRSGKKESIKTMPDKVNSKKAMNCKYKVV